ncbi:MAG: hypothetical protein O2912_08535 [Proteobacteria bacterium]|nr:hypothetical protein [Pseudomonadota bacterium]
MAEISTANILTTNFFSVAPIARAAGGGVFVSTQANALNLASDDAARAAAAIAQGREAPQPRFVAFNSSGQLVGLDDQTRGTIVNLLA